MSDELQEETRLPHTAPESTSNYEASSKDSAPRKPESGQEPSNESYATEATKNSTSEGEIPSEPQAEPAINADPLDQVQKLLTEGKRDAALELVIQVLTNNPANPKALYLYAQLTADRDNAIQALKNVLQVQPGFFEARLLLERLQASLDSGGAQKTGFSETPSAQTAATFTAGQATTPTASAEPLLQQMLVQHQMLMQQQMVNQQQFSQQQLMNQQQIAQQQIMQSRGVTTLVANTNGLAFWLGAIAAFFGFFGVAHIINGKIGTGVVYLILGFIWDVVAAMLAATVVGACIALPLHLIFVYYNAKSGANSTGVVSGVTVNF